VSEFECSNGHMPAPSTIKHNHCPCGARIIRMDGMSERQLTRMDREWDRAVSEHKEELEEERVKGGEEE